MRAKFSVMTKPNLTEEDYSDLAGLYTRRSMPSRTASSRASRNCEGCWRSSIRHRRSAPSRHTRRRGRAPNSGALQLFEKGRRARVSIDNAHLATEHIDQLRQILNTRVPKEFADPCRLPRPSRFRMSWVMRCGPE